MNMLSVKVIRKMQQALDIQSLELADPDGKVLPPFSAGSHIDVHLPGGIVRQYSLCNDPLEQHRYLICVLRDAKSRGGSVAVHERIAEGDLITISEPRNNFAVVPASRYVLLAGGIGVAPLLCIAERLAHVGSNFELHYCTRSRERMAFIDRIRRSTFAEKVQFHFDDGDDGQKLNLDTALAAPDERTHAYVCGPTGFIQFAKLAMQQRGWLAHNVHVEHFSAVNSGPMVNRSFDVKVASSGRCYPVAADQSVLSVLMAAGFDIPRSCEEGVCGTCVTGVLAGEVEHRDSYFCEAERAMNRFFTPCCSRARSNLLVLDL